jgi:hypothetical protein
MYTNVIPEERFNEFKQRAIQAGKFTLPAPRQSAYQLMADWALANRLARLSAAEHIQVMASQLARKMTVFSDEPREQA